MSLAPPETWPGADGNPISCREKVKVLAENHVELAQVMRDASICGLGQTAPSAIESAIDRLGVFR